MGKINVASSVQQFTPRLLTKVFPGAVRSTRRTTEKLTREFINESILYFCVLFRRNGGHSLLDGGNESEVLSSATICVRNVAIRKRSEPVEITDLYYICIYIYIYIYVCGRSCHLNDTPCIYYKIKSWSPSTSV